MFRSLAILSFFVFCFSSSKARPDSARFVHFDISNGFPSNNVYSLLKDKKGYVWFATDKGVVKYNGYSFTEYNTGTGLPSDDVWQLYADNSDRIWLYGFGYEFGYIKNNKYKAIPVISDERVFSPYHLAERGDLLYFITGKYMNRLVVVYGDIVKEFVIKDTSERLLASNADILRLGKDFDMLFRDMANNVYKRNFVDPNSENKFVCTFAGFDQLYKSKQNFSPTNRIYRFRFNGDVIQLVNLENCTYKPVSLKELGADADEKIYVFNPHYMQSNTEDISVLVTNKNMYVLDSNLVLRRKEALIDVIPSGSQLAYRIVDNSGITWMTTNSDGVWATPARQRIFSKESGLSELDDKIFLGTINTRSYWGDNKTRTVFEVQKNKVVNKINFQESVFFKGVAGYDSLIYIGSIEGVYSYNRRTKVIAALKPPDRVDRGNAEKISNFSAELVFSSINKVSILGDRLFTVAFDYTIAHSITRDSIISELIHFDRFEGVRQVGNSGKLLLFNKEKILVKEGSAGNEIIFNKQSLKELGIGNIKQMETDRFGNWYVLDDEHLTVWNVTSKKIARLELNLNMRGAFMQICDDKIVIAGNFGVGYAPIKAPFSFGSFRLAPNYNIGRSSYHQVNTFVITNDGYALLKTDVGMFSFTMDQLEEETTYSASKDQLFRFIVSAPEERVLRSVDTLSVGQNESNLVFDVVNYHGRGDLTYNYTIKSTDKLVSSSSGEIFLELFEPGEYHEVWIRVEDELFKSPPYRIFIYRYPMWWQTNTWKTIFWVSGVVLLLGLVVLIILITKYLTAKKNERKRAMTELELQAIHSQINPHFIFNTLSAALFYINRKRFDDAYTHVAKFSQLLRSYLKSSQDRYVILGEEIKMLRNYIELQQIRFEEKFAYRIEIDNKLPLDNIKIPSLLLQPLVENAINHGLFHKENGGILLLKFEQGQNNTELVCTIDDNGVGREAAKKINEASRTRDSYGTKLTHQLLEIFKQYENLDIKLDYYDKKPPETGTIVTLTLKNIKYVT